MNNATVLVVEDDPTLREALCDTLDLAGYSVISAGDGKAALKVLEQQSVGMVVSDVQMRPMNGQELLNRIKADHPAVPVLLMTAYGNIEKAVTAMRDGAVDYLAKPFEPETLLEKVRESVVDWGSMDEEVIADDLRTRELLALAGRVANTDTTVMIGGESGTGKEVFARYIHRNSSRREGPFVAINCAAIPDNMLEAMLFGHEKGAYTGAYSSAAGKFEQAQGGTLLLDEISEMDLGLQAKLLRVLQEREVERIGGSKVIPLDVRVLATSNRNLREEVSAGRFREDLFYRLNVFPIHLPPLRERTRDILPLARFMLRRQCTMQNMQAPRFLAVAEQRLLSHNWPGNVRELDNVIQRALILCNGTDIGPDDLSFEMEVQGAKPAVGEKPVGRLNDDLRSVEEQMILDALRDENGSRKSVAERLGISQRTLRYKIARLKEAGVAIPG
ncbi:sigma-54-dependent transcriptional regulator [Solemya velesiana gill symbiont]|uniref:Sigma-54-dependent Fis family transcriptional regulator n=1 Tax=Solemya velesiana gill symbiont TaxID=1918948 RepID=A0A1T2KW01_9GAMM|nr:sigma-54 dependent transcriptional regulator [Solemya velesiana gill symbiont]OOZ37004.1 sigma-54-dependent Fis family transcriptional regulator [Solemya velesiana gill symbiont]